MAKFTDFHTDPEVKVIVDKLINKFPAVFDEFDSNGIYVIHTEKKKSRKPINLRAVNYPFDVYINKPYIVEVFDEWWKSMTEKQKNTAVFHIMCAIPEGGFDEQSKHFGKKLRPQIEMYMLEFAACGGVPNWMENPLAKDPMEQRQETVAASVASDRDPSPEDAEIERVPVTVEDVSDLEKTA